MTAPPPRYRGGPPPGYLGAAATARPGGAGRQLPQRDRTGSRVLLVLIAALVALAVAASIAGYWVVRGIDADRARERREEQLRNHELQAAAAADVNAEAAMLGSGDIAGWCALGRNEGVERLMAYADVETCEELTLTPEGREAMAEFTVDPADVRIVVASAAIPVGGTSLERLATTGRDTLFAYLQPDGRWALSMNYLADFRVFSVA